MRKMKKMMKLTAFEENQSKLDISLNILVVLDEDRRLLDILVSSYDED